MIEQIKFTELVRQIALDTGVTQREVLNVLRAFEACSTETLVGGRAVPVGRLGKLVPVIRKGREGCNPRTGERIVIPDRRTVVFRASSSLKQDVA